MLKKAYRNKNFYVPWSWKNSDPKKNSHAAAFRDAMTAQSHYMTNLWVVPVHGISEKQMDILQPTILKLTSVSSIEKTKATKTEGKWAVLVKKSNFTIAKREVMTVLEKNR